MQTRVEKAHADLQTVVDRVRTSEFEPVHAGRWRHRETRVEIETGYSYGEGVVRVFDPGNHQKHRERMVLRGSPTDLDRFNELFPVA